MSIEVRNISKTFGSFVALRDVSLSVAGGELVALLGPSGSGKTTLLRIIAGLERPDPGSGSIRFHDEDVADRGPESRKVGFVFQHYALFRHLTVFENVAFGLRVRPRRDRPHEAEIRRRVNELLALVQLDFLADRYPHQLSGGQRQRVALARALAVEPRVLLLDEPFGALDAKVRRELRGWLRELHRTIHVTSVFVTHDQDEALELADRVVVMNAGRIEQVGPPDDVFHNPATEFVMDFLGQVNRFRGRFVGDRLHFAEIAWPWTKQVQFDAGAAQVFVRPHQLEVSLVPQSGPSFPAEVLHVHSAGPTVRLELRTRAGERVSAELPQAAYRQMSLCPGAQVYVAPREIRVFAENAVC